MSRGKRLNAGAEVGVDEAVAWLRKHATKATLAGMARYGIPQTNALGVKVGETKAYAKKIGQDHGLALDLWETGIYEARLLAGFVDDPKAVTSKQMDAWARDFDSWAIVDTICFHLFDRTPLAWKKIPV
jgi:3-methyladenine DNA glycosylase AlkD